MMIGESRRSQGVREGKSAGMGRTRGKKGGHVMVHHHKPSDDKKREYDVNGVECSGPYRLSPTSPFARDTPPTEDL